MLSNSDQISGVVHILVNIWLPPRRVRGQSRLRPRSQAHVPHRREGRPAQDHRRCELQLRSLVDDADTQECFILMSGMIAKLTN